MQDIHKLIDYINSLSDFIISEEADSYQHMGAVVIDGILQASLNYASVVKPRVNDVLVNYPKAITTSDFLLTCNEVGLKNIIHWKDDKKPGYIIALLNFLKANKLETVDQLRNWLDSDENIDIFVSENKGIGEVTAQYFRILVGSQSVKIDRHVRKFLANAGINNTNDKKSRDTVMSAAKEMGIKPTTLDYSIWKYQS